MRNIIPYVGGKSRAVKHLLKYFPPDLDALCSPFVGGGSVELTLNARGVKVFAYDAFEPLVAMWQQLLTNREQFIELLGYCEPLTREQYYELYDSLFAIDDAVERALSFYLIVICSFRGNFSERQFGIRSDFSIARKIKRLNNIAANNFTVQHNDFTDSILQHENTFLYCDPPYLINRNYYGVRGSHHRDFPHKKLASLLKRREQWVLSYNDCKEIRELYKDFRIMKESWCYSISHQSKTKHELVILSQDIEID